MIENVSNELKKYFEGKPIVSALLGLDMILLLGVVLLDFLGIFVGLGLIGALIDYAMILAILLCLANRNFNALMMGLGAKAIVEIVTLIYWLARMQTFFWESFFSIIIFGFFAYMAYKKTLER